MELISVARFESDEDAQRAAILLRHAGITPHLMDGELRVREDYAFTALQLLNAAEPRAVPATATAHCPECGSFETRTVPPYAHMFSAVVAACVFYAAWTRGRVIGMITLALIFTGIPVWYWLVRISGKQKCRKCGWLFAE